MTDTRTVVTAYMDNLCAGRFTEAFDLFAPDAVYTITGKTKISGSYKGLENIQTALGAIISNYFKTLPAFTVGDTIVDGDRAAVLLTSTAEAVHGIYDQNYVFVFRVKDGRIVEKIENLDSIAVETALLGRKLVDA
ncbi:Ketosteroid isomerase-related protein [Sphingobium faniae]|nr:Ketosteroid isomerase-related protein [Sphingobium faniae]